MPGGVEGDVFEVKLIPPGQQAQDDAPHQKWLKVL